MDVTVSTLRALILRWHTWAGSTAQEMARLVALRDRIEAQADFPALGIEIDADLPGFSGLPQVDDRTVTLDLSREDMDLLLAATRAYQWRQDFGRWITDEITALPAWLRAQINEAQAVEAFEAIPAERRKKLLGGDA